MIQTFIDVATLLSAAGTCIAAFLIWFQIKSQRDWNRLQASHEILNRFVSGEIENSLEHIRKKLQWDILHDKKSYGEVVKSLNLVSHPESYQDLNQHLQRLFRRFEAICISMNNNIIVESICREYIFSILTTLYNCCEDFIKEERVRRDEKKIFEFVELYAKKWRSGPSRTARWRMIRKAA